MMKKRIFAGAVAMTLALGLVGCGNQKPSLEEVEKAIEAGNVTMDDALEKGWITQEWVDDYMEQNNVPAESKLDAGAVADFTTTTLSGEAFTKGQLGDVALFAFLDPEDQAAETFFQNLVTGYESVKEKGAEIVVCTKKEGSNEMFANAPFPVILYNDSLKEAIPNHKEMVEGSANIGSWYVNGSFYSAWYSMVEAEELADSAAAFVQMQQELNNGDSSANGGMAVMG